MAELSEAGIIKLIDRYKETYIGNPSILLSGYSQENQTVADYEGRQLLELMQNADDAKSDIVYIKLDTQKQKLTVSNNGEPFIIEGVESLMYTGLTTKNKFEYIGNKGLGFRSVLSWVNWVEVKTKDVSFRFSKGYAERFYKEHLQVQTLIKERVVKEKAEKRLDENDIPIATLAFPELLTDKESEYTTSIILQFKSEELIAIEEQIDLISEETLLFLPNIRKIIVTKDGETTKHLQKEVDTENLITINSKTWNVHRKRDQVYDGNVKFNYAIAWQDEMEDTGFFYNYFPTDVETNLPCIIHATFDLTNNRKEINNTAANKHILDCIVESLAEIVSTHIKKETPDWDAYIFLTPISNNSRKFFLDFYKEIKEYRERIGCYPTLDGSYVLEEDAIYHGEVFSQWVLRNNLVDCFSNLLMPIKTYNIYIRNRYTFSQFEKIVDDINLLLTLKMRTELIHHLVINDSDYFSSVINANGKLPLLLDVNGDVVSSDIQVFTKDTDSTEFEIPKYIGDIAFISTELYASIGTELQEEIKEAKLETESGDSRALKRLVNSFVNIGSDDITDVILHIVSLTNSEIKHSKDPQSLVKQMVASLYSIFDSNKNRRGNLTTIKKIPLLSRGATIVSSEELFFGKEYTNGVYAELIFEDVRVDADYLADNTIWQLDGSKEYITNFFKWLNVNLYSKYEKIEKKIERWDYDDYVNFLFNTVDHSRKDVYKTYSVESIFGIETILKHPNFNLEKLIAWISKDELFLNKLQLRNDDKFFTNFGPEQRDYTEKPSYLSFLIYQSGITKNVIAEIPGGNLDNIQAVNFKHPLLANLPNYKTLEILDLLHIKSSFNELNPEHAYILLRGFGSIDNVKKSQQVYQLFYEYFKVNEETQLKDYALKLDDIKYICRKGGIGKSFEIKSSSEVYYSDNKMLPQKILDRYWFINLPKRIGENRVQTFFGVKLIKDISSDIQTASIEDNKLNIELEEYINRLKVYILCYRLGSQKKKDNKEEIVRSIKAFKVRLVKNAKFKLGDEAYSELEDYEFIPHDKEFLLKFGNERSLEDLQLDRLFCDAITEMLCITFKVNELKDTFWRIFKNGGADAKHNLISDEKFELLEEAKKLLGVSDNEKTFWNKILKKDLNSIEDADLLKKLIENQIEVALPDYYPQLDFSNLGNNNCVMFLTWLTSIKKLDLIKVLKESDLDKYHQNNLKDSIRDVEPIFKKLLWTKANNSQDLTDKKIFFRQLIELEPEFKKGAFTLFLKENQYNLDPNYKDAVYKYVLNKFSIDLNETLCADILIETKYKDLFKSYTFGIDVEDMEKIIKAETPEIYSYLYFKGFEDEIKAALELQQAEKIKDIQNNINDDDSIDATNLVLIESDMLCKIPSSNGKSGRKGGSHNSKGEGKKAIAGKKEENKVVKVLKANGYEVIRASETTDSKHYDIEYKKADEAWRFLEVKKDSGGYFFMSKYEKQTAISNEAREKYDIAIVNQNQVHIIKSPFNFKDEKFEKNSKFHAEPTEFKISFQMSKKHDLGR